MTSGDGFMQNTVEGTWKENVERGWGSLGVRGEMGMGDGTCVFFLQAKGGIGVGGPSRGPEDGKREQAVPSEKKKPSDSPLGQKPRGPPRKKNSGCSPKTSAECHAHTAFSPDRKAGCQERSSGDIARHIAISEERYDRSYEYLEEAAGNLDETSGLDKGEGDDTETGHPPILQE